MLDLNSVTLLCVDNRNPILALRALETSRAHAHFARTVFLTSTGDLKSNLPDDIEVLPAPPIASIGDYSQFILKGLLPYVSTPHVLIIQWDGYLYNPAAWTPDFQQVDYIGARWFWQPPDRRVGNGGFSLRSRRLLEALQDERIQITEEKPEDEIIGCIARPLLEKEYGIRFADEPLADRFSFEASPRVGWPLGFHAFYNFCLVVPEDELVTLIPLLQPQAFAAPQTQQLMRNCAQLQQWRAVHALAENTLRHFPESAEVRQLLSEAQQKLSPAIPAVPLSSSSFPPPASSRNYPCPCGSGKRYKQCHGALANSAAVVPAAVTSISPDTLLRQAIAAHQQGNIDVAIQGYRALLRQLPDHPAQSYLAVLLATRGEQSEALKLAQRATQIAPNVAEYHNNLGLVLTDMDRFSEAAQAFKAALALKPDYAEAFSNLGLAYYEAGNPGNAIDAYSQGLTIAPEHPVLHWNRATARLATGDFQHGWDEYEWRLKIFTAQAHHYASERWDGSDCSGKTLLVHTEQGLGDALQFSRYLDDLARRGARVLLHAPKPLINLLASAAGVDSVHDIDAPAPAHDAHIPMLSLPKALGYSAPARSPIRYLRSASPSRHPAEAWVKKHAAPDALRIGLAWAGNPVHRNDRRRSMPFSHLQSLLVQKDARFFSLQKGLASRVDTQQVVALPGDYSFDDTAALIDQLDLVISVDTSIAHLASALGKPVWVALPFAPDWRWLFHGDTTPWYPTARLFRQPHVGDWASVIRQIQGELPAAIEAKKSKPC